MSLKKISEKVGIISKSRFITKRTPKNKIDEFEYVNELVNIINQIQEGKLMKNILMRPNKVFIEILLKLHMKKLVEDDLNRFID